MDVPPELVADWARKRRWQIALRILLVPIGVIIACWISFAWLDRDTSHASLQASTEDVVAARRMVDELHQSGVIQAVERRAKYPHVFIPNASTLQPTELETIAAAVAMAERAVSVMIFDASTRSMRATYRADGSLTIH